VDAPVAHLVFVALPYDRDSVISVLEARNPQPAEITRRLDSLFQIFRDPFIAYARQAYRVQSLEARLARMRLRMDSLPRSSPVYDSLYRAYATVSDSVPPAKRRRDDTQRRMGEVRNAIAPAVDTLRQAMARWKDSTYQGYDSITKVLGSGIGREPISDSTGRDGKVTLRLPRGEWWIYARSWDAWDPNSEWYWNVRVTGDRVVLDRASGKRLPRY
jgi:hypothetical protein